MGLNGPTTAVLTPAEANATQRKRDEAIYRTLTWRMIPFLVVCYAVSYLDRVNVAFAKLEMLTDLRFTETVYGLGAGVFFIGYFLFGVPSNLILRRIGAKRWIASIMVIWGVLSGLMAYVTDSTQFFALRFFLGIAEAGFYPGIIVYLTCWFPSGRRAQVVSMFQSAIPISGVLGGPLSGWILDRLHGRYHHRGWQWLFLIESLPAVFLGLVARFYLDDGIRQAQWLSSERKDLLIRRIAEEDELKEPVSFTQVFTDLRVWRLCLLVFGLIMGLAGINFYMPTLLKNAGKVSYVQVGWLSAIPNVTAVFAMFFIARSSDAKRERRWHVAISAFLGASGLALSAVFSHDLTLTVSFLSLAAIGIMSACPLQWSFATAFLGGSGAASAIALINSVGSLAGFVGPSLVGWLIDLTQSTTTGVVAMAACVGASGFLALGLPARLVNK